ncbi:MAG: hypothetical protein ACLRZZ_00410 [Enterocloster sp.]
MRRRNYEKKISSFRNSHYGGGSHHSLLRQGCQDHYSGRGGNTGRHHRRGDGWGDRDADTASDSETAAESQSSESASQEAALLEEAEDVSHAGAELEQSEIKPFAEKVQKAVADKDMEALAGLCAYPVYVSLGEGQGEEIADEAAFLKMDADKIFTESLLKEIADTDVDTLEQFGAGVIMGEENSIIFNNVDGQAAITGINLN